MNITAYAHTEYHRHKIESILFTRKFRKFKVKVLADQCSESNMKARQSLVEAMVLIKARDWFTDKH